MKMRKWVSLSRLLLVVVLTLALLGETGAIALTDNMTATDMVALARSKMDERLLQELEMRNPTDEVTVYVWLNDIDSEQVENEVVQKIGYGIDELTVIEDDLDTAVVARALSAAQDTATVEVVPEFAEYVSRTAQARAKEKERTDRYISSKREVASVKHVKANDAFLTKQKNIVGNVEFCSAYAPMVIVTLPADKVVTLAESRDVVSVSLYEEMEAIPCGGTLQEMREAQGLNKIYNQFGLTGAGVVAGILESDTITNSSDLPASRFTVIGKPGPKSAHANNSANIMAGTNGVAPGTRVYSRSTDYDKNGSNGTYTSCFFYAMEDLLSAGVTVINCSLVYPYGTYSDIDAYVDYAVSHRNVSFTVSAGNNALDSQYSGLIQSPALSYNGITVGGYDDLLTTSTADDIMYSKSSYRTAGNSCKPDIVASQSMLGGGTSSSAPYVAGTIALMQELRPSLKAYPQAVKAILMASCQRKALKAENDTSEQETMAQGLTNKQGAGVVDTVLALCITAQGTYGVRQISSSTTPQTISFRQPAYGNGMNVSIAWLQENTLASENQVNIAAREDLDLYLKQNNSTLKSSTISNSSTEMVYVTPSSTNNRYTIEVRKYSSSTATVRYGYAWCVSKNWFPYTADYEGVYYLKNANSGYYLSKNSTGTLSVKSYVDSTSQQWIVRKKGQNDYVLTSGVGTAGDVIAGTQNGNIATAKVGNDDENEISLVRNNDGSASIIKRFSGIVFELDVANASTAVNATVRWELSNSGKLSQRWFLEPYAYNRGDVNLDGKVDSSDSSIVLKASVNSITLDAIPKYLADANGDGNVNSSDASLIMKYAAGNF